MIRLLISALWLCCGMSMASAQQFHALARVDSETSVIEDLRSGVVHVSLGLTQGLPWRLSLRDAPARLLIDFREVDWRGVDLARLDQSDRVTQVQAGQAEPGWSRLAIALDGPYLVDRAEMATDPVEGTAQVKVRLRPATPEAFQAEVARTEPYGVAPVTQDRHVMARRQTGDRPLRVVLDPGHGGWDSGAERRGLREADLVLRFGHELKEALLRRGGFEVYMTRENDRFVALADRISIARAVEADVFLSLHADALAKGRATGATVYTLSDTASDAVAAELAETHARDDLLLGLDLADTDDEIAMILMGLAQREVAPRSEALARSLVSGLDQATERLYKRPHQRANFVVLKAPDIPSALIELGFMSTPRDLDRLIDPAWRARAATGIVWALEDWAVSDATEALRLRN